MTRSTRTVPSRSRRFILTTVLVLVLVGLVFMFPATAPEVSASTPQVQAELDWGQMPLYFIANQGQLDEAVAYYVQGSDKTLYLTPEGLTFSLTSAPDGQVDTSEPGAEAPAPGPTERWTLKLDYLGAQEVAPQGQEETEAVISYFRGDAEDWNAGIPTYASVLYPGLWEGIDLVYSGTQDQLKQEFLLQAGADPAQIRLSYRGASLTLDDQGALAVSTPLGGFTDAAPLAYQDIDGQRVDVPVQYSLEASSGTGAQETTAYGFSLGAYDPSLPLVIDPAVLVYCGYIGGSYTDYCYDIAVDANGCAYVTGSVDSTETGFPLTTGPDTSANGGQDAFVAKVNAAGTALIYCGYIGGSGHDYSYGVAVDVSGCAYVAGYTLSTETTFPVVGGPDTTHNIGYDAFVAKVNAAGTGLTYCGYIGGSGEDRGYGIAVDASGCAYVTGYTGSGEATFPVGGGPDLTHNMGYDAFVAKVNAAGTGLTYCGYIGGSGEDDGYGIAVDTSGCAYVTGETYSDEGTFPVVGSLDATHNGGSYDAFVAKVSADGTTLSYSGYIGGGAGDTGHGIAVDTNGCAYIVGETRSNESSFPVAGGPDTSFNGGNIDVFVAKVNSSGAALGYCGYIGGDGFDIGQGIAVDSGGCAYVTGYVDSTETTFPVTGGPDDSYNGGSYDAFVAKLTADGASLDYCGYIGGNGMDIGRGVAVDATSCAYVTGYTGSTGGTFPEIVGPDTSWNGGYEVFVAKVQLLSESRYQQDDPLITCLGDWTTGSASLASGGSYAATDQLGAAAMIEFEGVAVSLIMRTAPWYGEARVTFDAGTAEEQVHIIDLYSPSEVWQDTVYTKSGLVMGEHTLLIEYTGDSNPSSSGTAIALDAVDITGTLEQAPTITKIDDKHASCIYAPDWSHWDASGYWAASEDTYAYTDQDGYQMSFTFEGTYASWVACTSNTKGMAKVTLDPGTAEQVVTTVDLYSPTTLWKQTVYNTGVLEDGEHTLVIECLYEKDPASWWYTVNVDRFDILGTSAEGNPPPPIPLIYQQNDTKITYLGGGWTPTSNPSASGGSYISTSQPLATAWVDFEGTEVTAVFATAPSYGIAKITLDPGTVDEQVDMVDLYSPGVVWQVDSLYTKSGLANTAHTLVVECMGLTNSSSTGCAVVLDALEITGTLAQAPTVTKIDDKDYDDCAYFPDIVAAGWSESAWSRWDYSGYWAAYDDTYAYTDQDGYQMTFTFEGRFASWVACTSNTKGKAEVRLYEGSVDPGNLLLTSWVDLYSSSTLWKQSVYSTGLLEDGTYVLEIECLYEKNWASHWYTIDVDRFDIIESTP